MHHNGFGEHIPSAVKVLGIAAEQSTDAGIVATELGDSAGRRYSRNLAYRHQTSLGIADGGGNQP